MVVDDFTDADLVNEKPILPEKGSVFEGKAEWFYLQTITIDH